MIMVVVVTEPSLNPELPELTELPELAPELFSALLELDPVLLEFDPELTVLDPAWSELAPVAPEPLLFLSPSPPPLTLLPEPLAMAPESPVVVATGHTVVDNTKVSVVTEVVLDLARQSVTLCGQAVIVAVRVLKMEEMVYSPSPEPASRDPDPDPTGRDVIVGTDTVWATGQTVVDTPRSQ
jgi:hypothetical protein